MDERRRELIHSFAGLGAMSAAAAAIGATGSAHAQTVALARAGSGRRHQGPLSGP